MFRSIRLQTRHVYEYFEPLALLCQVMISCMAIYKRSTRHTKMNCATVHIVSKTGLNYPQVSNAPINGMPHAACLGWMLEHSTIYGWRKDKG